MIFVGHGPAFQLSRDRRSDRRHNHKTGLKVYCELDTKSHPKGIVAAKGERKNVNTQRADFHGDWNYMIVPSVQLREAFVS